MSFSIVIIDDIPQNADLFKDICLEAGFTNVRCFNDPVSAVGEIGNGERPDFIITDNNMPVMKGTEVLRALEKQFGGKLNAVVVTSDPGKVRFTGASYPVMEKGPGFYELFSGYLKHYHSVVCRRQS